MKIRKFLNIFFYFFYIKTKQLFESQLNVSSPRVLEEPKKYPSSYSQCDQKILMSYGFNGYSNAEKISHKYCPNITNNCCTPSDETLSMHLWNSDTKFLLEKYYRTYLQSLKYILGFSQEATYIATDLAKSSNEFCRTAANDLLKLELTSPVIKQIYNTISRNQEKVGELRKSFYCLLCDSKTVENLREFWGSNNTKYTSRFYYSKEYCKKIVDDTILSNYYTVNYVKKYLENFAHLISCKVNNSTLISFNIPPEEIKHINNCQYFKDRYFFFFCEKYCENYSLTKISPSFDGRIKEMSNFVKHIYMYRNEVFYYPNKNPLFPNVVENEKGLISDLETESKKEVFIKSRSSEFDLNGMTTDFTYFQGTNPFISGENNLYQIDLTLNEYQCNIKVLQFYGMEGMQSPLDYPSLIGEMNNDYCPNIKYSCCSRQDFSKVQRLWDQKARDIKKYITKIFKVIQKISVLQSSLLHLSKEVRNKDTDICKEVDFTFFNSPIKYNEVYFYLENALESFAFIQKGFYCMLCDAKQHQFMALEKGYTRRVNVISHKFCNDLIFFFREFIMFKVYYLDPLMINTNMLFNCYEDTNIYSYNLFYNTTFQSVESCVEKGENCEFLCKEFKFGTTSEMFIGKLSHYYKFMNQIEEVLKKFDPNLQLEANNAQNELFIEEKDYPEEFFIDTEQQFETQTKIILDNYNMTQFEINVEEEGINLFDISIKSHLFLTNSLTTKIIQKNYGTDHPGEDNEQNGGTALDTFSFERENIPDAFNQQRIREEEEDDQFEEQRKMERNQENPNKPDKASLVQLFEEVGGMEKFYDKQLRENSLSKENFGDKVDFGEAGQTKFGLIWFVNSIIVFLF